MKKNNERYDRRYEETQNSSRRMVYEEGGAYQEGDPYQQRAYQQDAPYQQSRPFQEREPYQQGGPYNKNASYGQNTVYQQNQSTYGEPKNGTGEVMDVQQPVPYSMSALFGGRETEFHDELFTGAIINAICGGVKLNLDYAVIETDVSIDIMCICGGVEIYVPEYVNVVVDSLPIIGGVSNKTKRGNRSVKRPGAPTIFIRATCICGGVDIK